MRELEDASHLVFAEQASAAEFRANRRRSIIYFIQAQGGGPVKIGRSTVGGLRRRLESLQIGHPEQLEVRHVVFGDMLVEWDLHTAFSSARIRGEWFEPTPALLEMIA